MVFSRLEAALAATLLMALSACGSTGAPSVGDDGWPMDPPAGSVRDGGGVAPRADGGSARADGGGSGGTIASRDGGLGGSRLDGGSTSATTGSRACSEVYQCANGCGAQDPACVQDCLGTGTAQAQTQVESLSTCLANQCSGQSGSALQACARAQCATDMTACFGATTTPVDAGTTTTTGGTGGSTCVDVVNCLNACPQNDSACNQVCMQQGSPSAQQEVNALAQCLSTNCGTQTGSAYQTCAQRRCATEITACQNDTGTGTGTGTGAANCGGIITCLNACPSTDQACSDRCIATGTSTAQSELQSLDDCLNQFCATVTGNAAFNACASRYCSTEIQRCEGLGAPADGGVADGGARDGGVRDGGVADGGVRDGGTVADGGVRDGGVRDGGTVADGGVRDGGTTTACADTWNNYAHGFFNSYCNGCHSFPTAASVRGSTSQSRISSGNMPRGTSLSSTTRARILAWFACGAL